jgi:hypothetical protein
MRPTHLNSIVLALATVAAVVTFRGGPGPDTPADAIATDAALIAPWPEVVRLRALAKDRLAREVAAGRLPLLEAAALFRELDRVPPSVEPARLDGADASVLIPGRSDAERWCQRVLAHVQAALGDRPAERAEAEDRVVAEFFRVLRADGAVRLPDPFGLPTAEELLTQTRAGLSDKARRDLFGDWAVQE